MISPSVLSLGLLIVLILIRLYTIIPAATASRSNKRRSTESCSLAIFLGSGGHTSEILALLSAISFSRYTPRTYIVSEGDRLSAQKATALEIIKAADSPPKNDNAGQYSILTIPRARRVHQSLFSVPPSVLRSLLICIYHVTVAPLLNPRGPKSTFADALLINGPGTCFVLCVAIYVNRFLGLPTPRIIYIESFARVRSVSLSGRLLRPFVNRFIVQWPQLLHDRGRGECHDWLV